MTDRKFTGTMRILRYAVSGFILGMFFPLIATALKLDEYQIGLSFSSVRAIHLGEPLMLIIDSAPIILSASYALIGIQAARFQQTSQELDQKIASEHSKTVYEKYFLEALMRSSSFAIVRLDPNHHVITCNQRFEELFGYECADLVGVHLDEMIASEDLLQEASQITASVSSGNLERLTSQRKRKDGSLVDVEIVGVPVSVGGEKIGVLGLYHDISDRLESERALRNSESRFRSLFQDSPISLWEEDFSGVKTLLDPIGSPDAIIDRLENDQQLLLDCQEAIKILDVNQATLNLYNATSKDSLMAGLTDILVDESLDAFREEIISLVRGENKFDTEIIQKKVTGQLIHGWLRLTMPKEYQDSWERVYISIVDITERKRAEQKMRFLSFHDAMTGLYNRAYFEEELQRLENSRQYPISIIACDLDKLKEINDTQGHAAGDNAIRSAALILGKGTFRKEDVVARTGGDEFVIILPGVDLSANTTILERLQDGVKKFNSSQLDDGLYRPISISFGYAVAQQNDSLEEVVNQADRAMYIKKKEKYQTPPNR